jgi:hypothetical protein
MFAANGIGFNSKAKVPCLRRLASEFPDLSESHIWRVCVGERQSPESERILKRLAQLIKAASADPPPAGQPEADTFPAQPSAARGSVDIAGGSAPPVRSSRAGHPRHSPSQTAFAVSISMEAASRRSATLAASET